MEKAFIGVRDVDEATFRKFKTLAVKRKLKLNEAFREAVNQWAEKNAEAKTIDVRNIFKIKGIIKTKDKVKWSEEIDDILYGLKK